MSRDLNKVLQYPASSVSTTYFLLFSREQDDKQNKTHSTKIENFTGGCTGGSVTTLPHPLTGCIFTPWVALLHTEVTKQTKPTNQTKRKF